jgi:rubrerythrin
MAARNTASTRSGAERKPSGRSTKRKRQSLNSQYLIDFLSEMLAVEQGGTKLYQKALDQLEHPELKSKLKEFLQETERHAELCSAMLEAAGGDAEYMSAGAKAAEQKAAGLLKVKVPQGLADLNNVENLVLAETKDRWDWQMFATLAPDIEGSELKRMAISAVREVGKQENDHATWSQRILTKLAKEASMHQQIEGKGRSEEAAEAAVQERSR